MNLEILRKVGLSDGEVKVYSALLELGPTSINKIHEKVGMDRRNIYDIINKLIERGLVSYSESNKKRIFKISDPKKILSYIEEKKSGLDEIKKEVQKIIPAIKLVSLSSKKKSFAEVFKGPEGMKSVWDDMLNYDAVYWIGSGLYVPDRYPAYWKEWNKQRARKHIKSLHLFRYEKKGIVNKKLFTGKFLPKEFSGNPTVTAIYGDKVAQLLFGKEMSVFLIENEELAENYKKYHKYLYDNIATD